MPKRGKRKADFQGVHALLVFPFVEDFHLLLDLMRRFSAATRYAYNRLLEGRTREELKRQDGPLCTLFRLNTRYADDAILKAQALLDSARERGEDPRKVVFGGRGLFEKLKRKHLSGKPLKRLKREWRERRQGTLYSRGDRTKGGNLNLRLEAEGGALWLRVNLGNGRYAWALVKTGHPSLNALLQRVYASLPYNVELSLREGKVYAHFTWAEEPAPLTISEGERCPRPGRELGPLPPGLGGGGKGREPRPAPHPLPGRGGPGREQGSQGARPLEGGPPGGGGGRRTRRGHRHREAEAPQEVQEGRWHRQGLPEEGAPLRLRFPPPEGPLLGEEERCPGGGGEPPGHLHHRSVEVRAPSFPFQGRGRRPRHREAGLGVCGEASQGLPAASPGRKLQEPRSKLLRLQGPGTRGQAQG